MSERHQNALTIAFAVVALSLACTAVRLRSLDHFNATQSYEDIYYVPPPQWLPTLSLGYREALADLLWVRALVYFGEEMVQRGAVKHVYDYADAILTLDPMFRRVYHWVGMSGIYRPQEIGKEEVFQAIEYLERGANLFPDDGELAWDVGATYQYELKPLLDNPEDKKMADEKGLVYMQTAARLGAGPPWLVLANATRLRELGQSEQALRHLEEMYATVQDADTKAEIGRQIQRRREANYLEAFRKTFEEIESRRRADFPYLDPTLYLLVGPRPPIDGNAQLARNFATPELLADSE
ncbi:MAG: hypothetical protein KC416_12175 [Myxococcales bacterium]|nr:hypothetical protein [Myxococcales bacterium]